MFHTTLSKGKHIAQGKEKGILFKSKVKRVGKRILFKPK